MVSYPVRSVTIGSAWCHAPEKIAELQLCCTAANITEQHLDMQEEGAPAASNSARHNKGCNCKKSSCLKKYCECFQASINCSDNCKCNDCKNFEVLSPMQCEMQIRGIGLMFVLTFFSDVSHLAVLATSLETL